MSLCNVVLLIHLRLQGYENIYLLRKVGAANPLRFKNASLTTALVSLGVDLFASDGIEG